MGEPETVASLLPLFELVEDPRVDRTKAYPLSEILFLVVSAVVSGVNLLTDVEKFGQAKLDWLRKFLPYDNGIPSHDTIGRVLGLVEPDALERMFQRWMEATASVTDGVIAIDGQTLRGAIERGNSRSFIHMVSAFASANAVVLGQVRANEKSIEISAIPDLLETLHLKGNVVTIDAFGCQSRIARQIVQAGGDFLIAVKGNQPTLHADIIAAFREVDGADAELFHSQCVVDDKKAHRRKERRECQTLKASNLLEEPDKWPDVKSLIRAIAQRTVGDQESEVSERYFISSIANLSAERALAITRAHWRIENQLHWSLDVAFCEDDCRIYAENAAENLVVIRHIALNMLRSVQGLSGGISSKRNQAGSGQSHLTSRQRTAPSPWRHRYRRTSVSSRRRLRSGLARNVED